MDSDISLLDTAEITIRAVMQAKNTCKRNDKGRERQRRRRTPTSCPSYGSFCVSACLPPGKVSCRIYRTVLADSSASFVAGPNPLQPMHASTRHAQALSSISCATGAVLSSSRDSTHTRTTGQTAGAAALTVAPTGLR